MCFTLTELLVVISIFITGPFLLAKSAYWPVVVWFHKAIPVFGSSLRPQVFEFLGH